MIHLHKGEYRGISSAGADKFFHIAVPYMFDEKELVHFLKECLMKLENITKGDVKVLQ